MRLPGSDKVIVGYDLGKDYAQISCYVTGKEEEITTLSSVAGSQVYTIPGPEQETGSQPVVLWK